MLRNLLEIFAAQAQSSLKLYNMSLEEKLEKIRSPKLQNQQQVS
jgi:hypothetical protein